MLGIVILLISTITLYRLYAKKKAEAAKKKAEAEQTRERERQYAQWCNSEEGKRELARRKLKADIAWSTGKPCSDERSIVTGDYYLKKDYGIGKESDSITKYYCKHSDSEICMYCSRRKELFLNDKYYYGESDKCYYYSRSYD